jgi:hypothetical protein
VEEKNKRRISKAIENRVFPGCVVGIVWSDGSRMIIPAEISLTIRKAEKWKPVPFLT